MQEVIGWSALFGAGSAILALIAFWFSRGKAEADAMAKAEGAHSIAIAALAKVDLLGAQLGEARVEFARDYASHADLAAAEVRYAAAIDGLRVEFRGINERLDRIIERFSGVKD